MTRGKPKATHCPRGHAYDDVNGYQRPGRLDSRNCRACGRERATEKRRAEMANRALHPKPVVSHPPTARMRYPSEYIAWGGMIQRCTNPNQPAYRQYGARGIQVYEAWRVSFEAFITDVGPKPSPEHSLDRIDVNGDYAPANVRWATRQQQARNKRMNRLLTAFGRTQCLSEWAEELGINITTLHSRLTRLGWSPEMALSTPQQGPTYDRAEPVEPRIVVLARLSP